MIEWFKDKGWVPSHYWGGVPTSAENTYRPVAFIGHKGNGWYLSWGSELLSWHVEIECTFPTLRAAKKVAEYIEKAERGEL